MNILLFFSFLVAASNLFLGFFVWYHGKTKRLNIIFLFLAFVISGWVITNGLTYHLTDYNLIDVSGKLSFAFSAMIVPLFFSFVYYFSNIKSKNNLLSTKTGLIAGWILGFSIAWVSIFTNLIQIRPVIVKPHLVTLEQGKLYPIFFAYIIIFIFWAFTILIIKFRSSVGIERQKIKHLLFGFGIASLFGVVSNLLVVGATGDLEFEAQVSLLGPLFTIVMVGFMSYSILRFRLMDIRVVIKKSAVQIFSFAIIFGLYLLAMFFIKESIGDDESTTTYIIIATLLAVITIEPLRKFVHKSVDRIFDAKDNKKEDAEKRLFIALKSQQTLDNLISSINDIIKELFLVEHVEFLPVDHEFFKTRKETYHYFRNTGRILIPEELPYRLEEAERYFFVHKELKDSEYSALISIGRDELFIGCFALGKRNNNKAYTVEEVREIKRLQDDFTESILNARLYQQAIQRIKI